MPVYLVQHGKARAEGADAERSLTDQGRADVERIAGVAAQYRVPVSSIVHSGKLRARQTAAIFGEILGPGIPLEISEGMNPGDDVTIFASRLTAESNTMFVGHLPFMEKLVSYLLTGAVDRAIFKFQNGGIVCLDRPPSASAGSWIIIWTLMPSIP